MPDTPTAGSEQTIGQLPAITGHSLPSRELSDSGPSA
jgi:hypothetical protein